MHPASTKYLEAKSSMPIFVKITLAPDCIILVIRLLSMSHYFCLIFYKFFGSSTKTWIPICILNLFKLKSMQAILAFLIWVGICWCALTVCKAYPLINWLSVELCPCALRIFIDFIGNLGPNIVYCFMVLID